MLFAESLYFLDIYRRFDLLIAGNFAKFYQILTIRDLDKVAPEPTLSVLSALLTLNILSMYIWMQTLVLTSFQIILWGFCWNRVYPK